MKYVIPTLRSTQPIIVEPDEILKYVIDTYIFTPKGINDTFKELEVSLSYDLAVTSDSTGLKNKVVQSLVTVLARYFPELTVEVSVSIEPYRDSLSTLSIDARVISTSQTYASIKSIKIDEAGRIMLGK